MVLYSRLLENLPVSRIVLVITCRVQREGYMNHDLSHAALKARGFGQGGTGATKAMVIR